MNGEWWRINHPPAIVHPPFTDHRPKKIKKKSPIGALISHFSFLNRLEWWSNHFQTCSSCWSESNSLNLTMTQVSSSYFVRIIILTFINPEEPGTLWASEAAPAQARVGVVYDREHEGALWLRGKGRRGLRPALVITPRLPRLPAKCRLGRSRYAVREQARFCPRLTRRYRRLACTHRAGAAQSAD